MLVARHKANVLAVPRAEAMPSPKPHAACCPSERRKTDSGHPPQHRRERVLRAITIVDDLQLFDRACRGNLGIREMDASEDQVDPHENHHEQEPQRGGSRGRVPIAPAHDQQGQQQQKDQLRQQKAQRETPRKRTGGPYLCARSARGCGRSLSNSGQRMTVERGRVEAGGAKTRASVEAMVGQGPPYGRGENSRRALLLRIPNPQSPIPASRPISPAAPGGTAWRRSATPGLPAAGRRPA